ncbi:MAG: TldD/PmbA family protein [Clostridium sp.]
MDINIFTKRLFEKAKNKGFEDCEVYYVNRESLSIGIYSGEVEKYNLNNSFGLSFRGLFNNKMGYSYTEILDDAAVELLVEKAYEGVSTIENDDLQFIYEGDNDYVEVQSYHKELENLDPRELINLGLKMEKQARALSDKVVNIGGCAISYSKGEGGIINTKGLNLKNNMNILSAYVVPIVKDEENMYDGMGYAIAKKISDVDSMKIAKQGVDEALSKIGGKSISSGSYNMIINNEAMVSLLSTFSSIFSADVAQKGLSLLAGKEGEKIASDIVTLVDNPHLKDGLGSTGFDDEGVATYESKLIENGVLTTLLHNLKTANKAGVKTTGNGFKASYASPVSVSPTNFYIEKGEKTFEELLQEINNGIIITDFAGLHSGADSVTGDFSLAAKGFKVEEGNKTTPIEQITVSGNFFDLLKNIKVIGSDLKFPMSSVGCPSVIVEGLTVAGE